MITQPMPVVMLVPQRHQADTDAGVMFFKLRDDRLLRLELFGRSPKGEGDFLHRPPLGNAPGQRHWQQPKKRLAEDPPDPSR